MAEILVSVLLEQLASVAFEKIREKGRQVRNVKKEIAKLTSNLKAINAVLLDAEKRQFEEEAVKDWLEKLKDMSCEIDDVLDEWNTAILKFEVEKEDKGADEDAVLPKKVCFFIPPSWCSCVQVQQVGLRLNISCKTKELNEQLDILAYEKNKYSFNTASIIYEQPEREKTTSFIDVSEVFGWDKEKEILVNNLLSESSQSGSGLSIMPIVGFEGMGKTTLAQLVYNDDKVKTQFQCRGWVCVSDPFDEIKIAKAIIESLTGTATNLVELESLHQCISSTVEGKKFLLVLDDVWTEDNRKWTKLKEALKHGVAGSKVLVTTRKKEVAIMMEGEACMITLESLSEEVCWCIFSKQAFQSEDESGNLKVIGNQIVKKCNGVPLVAKCLGSLLYLKKKRTQWEDILCSSLWELKDVKAKVFAPFMLSYRDLPPVEKRCLSYCSIFPKDYEINKDEVIQMWISQGYLSWKNRKNLELEGEDCFENLAMRSFFQDFEKDGIGNIISCKMHDIVHDFVQFLTKNECSIMDVTGKMEEYSGKKLRHATLVPESDTPSPSSLYEIKGLRTLFVAFSWNVQPEVNLERLFSNLTCLRTLNLSDGEFERLPEGIEKLVHLRYLDLSGNYNLEELPNSICDLFKLQTLKLKGCEALGRLPDEIWKLVNLRHLYIADCDRLKRLPKGIAKLSLLRTLDEFCVPDYRSLMDNDKTLELEDLNMLKHLQGSLVIRKCGNHENGGQARRAQLKDKQYLVNLNLWFDSSCGNGGPHEEILEALEPHSNLECLVIHSYRGNTISPNWMMSLVNLKLLALTVCHECGFLPPLGKLASLEFLEICYCYKVKRVGVEFLGIENDENGALRRHQISFPKLKQLKFKRLSGWEKWELGINLGEEEEDNCFTIMPSLQSLEIGDCWRLTALPDFLQKIPLQRLFIARCPILNKRCREGEDWPNISHIPNIQLRD